MVFLRCYAELNDFLPAQHRQRESQLVLDRGKTVAELIAAVAIPPAAVELVLVNGVSRGLDCPLEDGDRVSLYPMFEAFDVTPLLRLRPHPMRQVRFVADAHLGRLARYLRLLGFDTLFANDIGDSVLARISAEERRVLLTRDRALLQRRLVDHGLWVPSTRPRDQLAYVLGRLDLYALFHPFTRCTICNGMLAPVSKKALQADLPPRVRAAFDDFWRCEDCGRVYWQGSHYDRLRAFVAQLRPERSERS